MNNEPFKSKKELKEILRNCEKTKKEAEGYFYKNKQRAWHGDWRLIGISLFEPPAKIWFNCARAVRQTSWHVKFQLQSGISTNYLQRLKRKFLEKDPLTLLTLKSFMVDP